MNFNNYYIWPKSFVEDSLENTSRDTKPEVSKYISKILKEEINELQEEELEKLIIEISYIASFYARLRRKIIEYTGGVILSRMMDEADFEAEFYSELYEIIEEE